MRLGVFHTSYVRIAAGLLLAIVVLPACATRSAHAQILRGHLVDAASSRNVPHGKIVLLSEQGDSLQTTLADGTGYFAFRLPAPGVYILRGSSLGYPPSTGSPVAVGEGRVVTVELRIAAVPLAMEPIIVVGKPRPWWQREKPPGHWGFWERKERSGKSGLGKLFSREEIDKFGSFESLVSFYGRPRSRCREIPILIDGFSFPREPGMRGRLIDWLPITDADVENIEIYRGPSQVPLEFGGFFPCGVIAIWTKR